LPAARRTGVGTVDFTLLFRAAAREKVLRDMSEGGM
jgi:hypothetical protein